MEAHHLVLERVGRDHRQNGCVCRRHYARRDAHERSARNYSRNGKLNICYSKTCRDRDDHTDNDQYFSVEFCEKKCRCECGYHHHDRRKRRYQNSYAVLPGKSRVDITEDDRRE